MTDDILVVYRPTQNSSWADRCLYLDDKYDYRKPYNHRSILPQEVVIEFDDEDKEKNLRLTEEVAKRIRKDKIRYALWDSGNKSYHLHFLIDTRNAKNLKLLKSLIIRHYAKDLEVLPDMRMAANKHLIRAEFGVHEKKQKNKKLIRKSPNYFKLNDLPQDLWVAYGRAMTTVVQRRTTSNLNLVDGCHCIKYLTSVTRFREVNDGRERAMMILIHVLKEKYSKEEMVEFLVDWYKYSGGYKFSPDQIARKVAYHWNRNYNINSMIPELMEELGQEEILRTCPVHKK